MNNQKRTGVSAVYHSVTGTSVVLVEGTGDITNHTVQGLVGGARMFNQAVANAEYQQALDQEQVIHEMEQAAKLSHKARGIKGNFKLPVRRIVE